VDQVRAHCTDTPPVRTEYDEQCLPAFPAVSHLSTETHKCLTLNSRGKFGFGYRKCKTTLLL